MALRFYTVVVKWLKLKVRKFWGLIFAFVEVTGKKLVGEEYMNEFNIANKRAPVSKELVR